MKQRATKSLRYVFSISFFINKTPKINDVNLKVRDMTLPYYTLRRRGKW